jgi:prevent-host-death family protein
MNTVTSEQVGAQIDDLLERVSQGEEIVITTDAKPVARLIPASAFGLEGVRQAVQSIKERRRQISEKNHSDLSDAEVKECVAVGRP